LTRFRGKRFFEDALVRVPWPSEMLGGANEPLGTPKVKVTEAPPASTSETTNPVIGLDTPTTADMLLGAVRDGASLMAETESVDVALLV
jgi:hypothetical protein